MNACLNPDNSFKRRTSEVAPQHHALGRCGGAAVPLLVFTGPDRVGSVGVPEWSPMSTWHLGRRSYIAIYILAGQRFQLASGPVLLQHRCCCYEQCPGSGPRAGC